MASPDRNSKKNNKFLNSFRCSVNGIITAVKSERNLRFHLTFSVLIILLGWILSISVGEWLVIIVVIGGIICAELMNSAIERVVDLVTEEYHPLAKQAKDIAAGAVLMLALTSVVIGIVIFGPRILTILSL